MKPSELLATEAQWSRRYYARDADGVWTHWDSTEARAFCPIGAAYKCYGVDSHACLRFLRALRAIVGGWISEWNDYRVTDHATMLAAVRLAEAASKHVPEGRVSVSMF